MLVDHHIAVRNKVLGDCTDTSCLPAAQSQLCANGETNSTSMGCTTMHSELALLERDVNTAPHSLSRRALPQPAAHKKLAIAQPDRFIAHSRSRTQLSTSTQTATDFLTRYSLTSVKQHVPHIRQVSSVPERVLDAPAIADDFYFNILDWSDSNVIAVALGSDVYSWHAGTGEISTVANVDPRGDSGELVSCVKWLPGTNSLCVSTTTGSMHVYDAGSGTRIRSLRGRHARVASLSWYGSILSSGSMDASIWNHDIRQKRHKLSELRAHKGEICGLSWRQDGRVLASGGNDNLVALWDARVTSRPLMELSEHTAAVKALAWCPWHMNSLATGGGSADRRIHFWNTNSGALQNSLDANAQVTALHWNSNNFEIVGSLGYPTNSVAIWSYPGLAKQAEIEQAHEDRILNAALSPDGSLLATCSADENIKFWRLYSKPGIAPGAQTPINRIAISRI